MIHTSADDTPEETSAPISAWVFYALALAFAACIALELRPTWLFVTAAMLAMVAACTSLARWVSRS